MKRVRESIIVSVGLLTLVVVFLGLTIDFGGASFTHEALARDKGKGRNKGGERKEVEKEEAEEAGKEEVDAEGQEEALERTREQVRMLDDLYKTAVVLITDKYVHAETDFSAGSAAVALFAAMKKKGWHEVRLVDASGDPLMEGNAPQDDFEKNAVKALKGGKSYFEEIVQSEGKSTLRAATPVPVVMQKCTMCHPHYKDVKEGEPIGILSYKVPVK